MVPTTDTTVGGAIGSPSSADVELALTALPGEVNILPGQAQTYRYEYEVQNRAGTYWFHPHPHGLTGGQAYRGLAGLLIVSDPEEAAAGLPSGAQDLPIMIQDRTFDADNQHVYLSGGGMEDMMGGMSGMQGMSMDRMMGFLGERILVNGQPDAVFSLATRAYRLRVLNGSNSRIYKLAWGDETPMTVIASDGGLLEKRVQKTYVTLGPGERVELWADFSDRKVGDEMVLMSREFLGAEGDTLIGGGMHGMDHNTARIGTDGKSFGGYMTLYALIFAPDVFHCGVAGAAPTDWSYYDTIYTERCMGTPAENPDGYATTNLINRVDQLQAAPLIIHGLADTNVHLQNTVNFIEALEAKDKEFSFIPLPNLSHSFRGNGLVAALMASETHLGQCLAGR